MNMSYASPNYQFQTPKRPLSESGRGLAARGNDVINQYYNNQFAQPGGINYPNSAQPSPYEPMGHNMAYPQSANFGQQPAFAANPNFGHGSMNMGAPPVYPQYNASPYGMQNNSFTAGMAGPSFGANDQDGMIQKLLEEMNSKQENELEAQNNEILKRIEQIERENQRLAQGADSDDELPNINNLNQHNLDYDDQKIIGDAVDRAIKQYEQAKAREEHELEMKRKRDEDRTMKMMPRPTPEDILFAPISDQELYDYATSLPPVSRPFVPPSLYKVRGHNQLEQEQFNRNTGLSFHSEVKRKPTPQEVKPGLSFNDLFAKKVANNQTKPISEPANSPKLKMADLFSFQNKAKEDLRKKQEDNHKQHLSQKHGYFDANIAKGKDLVSIFNQIRKR